MTIKKERPAKILYKYRTLDSNGYTQAMIEKGEIYFATAPELNDPCENYFVFENNVTRTLAYSERDILQYGGKIISEDNHGNCTAILSPEAATRYMMKAFKHHGVFSLSSNSDSIFMWSFYAAALHGICIGFDWRTIGNFFQYKNPPYRVAYQDHPITIPTQIISGEDNEKIVTTKSTYFSWEEEYRIFNTPGKKASNDIRNSIKEIIFGEHIPNETIETILKWAKGISNIQFFTAKRIIGKFQIQIDRLNVNDYVTHKEVMIN